MLKIEKSFFPFSSEKWKLNFLVLVPRLLACLTYGQIDHSASWLKSVNEIVIGKCESCQTFDG